MTYRNGCEIWGIRIDFKIGRNRTNETRFHVTKSEPYYVTLTSYRDLFWSVRRSVTFDFRKQGSEMDTKQIPNSQLDAEKFSWRDF